LDDGLREIRNILSERVVRAGEEQDRKHLPAGARIVQGGPYIPTMLGVAEHLAELAAKPGSGAVAKHVNGTYMFARPNEKVATIFERWDEARNRDPDSPSHAQVAFADVDGVLQDLAAVLQAHEAALALARRPRGVGMFRLVPFLALMLSVTVASLAHAAGT